MVNPKEILLFASRLGFAKIGSSNCETRQRRGDGKRVLFKTYPNRFDQNESQEYLIEASPNQTSGRFDHLEIITIKNSWRARDFLKRIDNEGLAIELLISEARKLSGRALGEWFEQVKDLSRHCSSKGFQFILSSGAGSISELVSGQCMDAILSQCEIDPNRHWYLSNLWLEQVLSKRMSANVT